MPFDCRKANRLSLFTAAEIWIHPQRQNVKWYLSGCSRSKEHNDRPRWQWKQIRHQRLHSGTIDGSFWVSFDFRSSSKWNLSWLHDFNHSIRKTWFQFLRSKFGYNWNANSQSGFSTPPAPSTKKSEDKVIQIFTLPSHMTSREKNTYPFLILSQPNKQLRVSCAT